MVVFPALSSPTMITLCSETTTKIVLFTQFTSTMYRYTWTSGIPVFQAILLNEWRKALPACRPLLYQREWPVLWLVFWFGFGFFLLNSEIIIPNWENNHNVKLSKTFHKNTAITWCDLHSISLNCQHLHLCMLLYFDLLIYDRLGTWRFTKSLTIPPLLKSCKIYTYLIKPLY